MSNSSTSRQVMQDPTPIHRNLQDEYAALLRLYEGQVERDDIRTRAIRNGRMSTCYRLLYIALLDTYPELLSGETITVSVWKIRENAGWISESSATKFLSDLQSIGAIEYDPGTYNAKAEKRQGLITIDIDIFPFPENFDTRATEDRKKGREREKDKREMIKLILQCEECGSDQIKYTLLPICKACGHKHAAIKDVPASTLTHTPIDSDENNLPGDMDDFVYKEPAPAFTDVPVGEKWPRHCRNWGLHKMRWNYGLLGLQCPICDPEGF